MDNESEIYSHEFLDKARLVILGEASTLTTFFLKNNQRFTKANYVQLSRLTSFIIENEDEVDLNDEHLFVDPLLKSLILLKSRLSKERIVELNASYFKPFCNVIVNKDVSGPITGLALQSILNFLDYGFIKDGEVVRLIGESVTKARFVGTDSGSDEAVLMQILSVLEQLIVSPFFSLTNGIVCEIMQSCFRIAFETRLSELLRKCSVKSLTKMVRALFARITDIDQDSQDFNYFYQDKSNASLYKLNRMGKRFNNAPARDSKQKVKLSKEESIEKDLSYKNYSIACIHELLSYLTSLINPLPDGQNSEYMISVGLNLLIVAFETASSEIGNKYCLLSVVKTDLAWNVMQLLKKKIVEEDRNLNTFTYVLRLSFLMFVNLRMHLKYQFEELILCLMNIITTMNLALETRDVCMEYLLLYFRHIPFLSHELFFNFDCDLYAPNILEDLLQLLSKNCFATITTQTTQTNALNFTALQMLSFEVLLSNLKNLQIGESDGECHLIANPASMIVNISNVKDVFSEKIMREESDFNICNNVKEIVTMAEASQDGETAEQEQQSVSIPSTSSPGELLHNFEVLNNTEIVVEQQQQQQQQRPPEVEVNTINKYCVTYIFPESSAIPYDGEQIASIIHKKKLLSEATEKFNQKPAKGIEFLREKGLVENDDDIVTFLKNNPNLDKRQIGDYISTKKNTPILIKFVESFVFKDIRIDEALRHYLESFRLPGEAALISHVLEQFAHHWHECNNCPFANEDAAFTLSYAIIMLNVDQHNTIAKRQTTPMTCDHFIANLRQVNGDKDFDHNMLTQVYYNIKNNEIVMPAEQTGVVRDKYLWKCLLRNSETNNGIFWFSRSSTTAKEYSLPLKIFNRAIFHISWDHSISTLTLVFDKLHPDRQPTLSRRVLNNGFTSVALLCASYGHLDNLIVNLSRFVTNSSRITKKTELVAHCLFAITKEYANELRSSWANIIRLILFWYDNKLLDNGFEIDDFATDSKFVFARMTSKTAAKQAAEIGNQSTFLSSFYSYFASNYNEDDCGEGGELQGDKGNGQAKAGDKSATTMVNNITNEYCQALVLIIEESKFLHIDSLIDLIRALINENFTEEFDDDIEVFKLEILVKIILMNRDRLSIFWEVVCKYLNRLMKYCLQSDYLTQRLISTVFRLAIRFTSRPDTLNDQIFFLIYQMLLTFHPIMLQRATTAKALQSFVVHCNCYLYRSKEWSLLFSMILAVAIGFYPAQKNKQSPEARPSGYTSDSELAASSPATPKSSRSMPISSSVGDLDKIVSLSNELRNPLLESLFTVTYPYKIVNVEAYEKCIDIVSFVIRDYLHNNAKVLQLSGRSPQTSQQAMHITSLEIAQMCVSVLIKFVEASIIIQAKNSVELRMGKAGKHSPRNAAAGGNKQKRANRSRFSRITNVILSSDSEDDSDDDSKKIVNSPGGGGGDKQQAQHDASILMENCSLKLLDLMHYFHLNAAVILGELVSLDIVWNTVWCPLLQGISFYCCDSRRPVRTHAFTFLHRTLLLTDLNALNAIQWESCFNKVLFPLLSKLLEPINMSDPIGMDETRMRTTNLLCKVFLQHLNMLLTLNTFTALWLTILDFMDKYIKADMQTDLVKEAIPESLKNILLVMKTAGCFKDTLAAITWDRINVFLPNLYEEMIMPEPSNEQHHPARPDSIQFNPNENLAEGHQAPVGEQLSSTQPEPAAEVSQPPPDVAECLTQQSPTAVAPIPIYDLPSTFIDMESVYSFPENVELSAPVRGQFSLTGFAANALPGTIVTHYTNTTSPPSYGPADDKAKTSQPNLVAGSPSSSSSPYPWPMPGNAQDSPTK